MATVSVLNTDSGLSGKTLQNLEDSQTVTGLKTFNRAPNAPFAVQAGSANVPNLDAAKLNGQSGPSGTIVGTTDTQTLTNKTVDALSVDNGAANGIITFAESATAKAKAWWDHTNAVLTLGGGTALSGLAVNPTGGTVGINIAPDASNALTVQGINDNYAARFVGSATSGHSRGIIVSAGTTTADYNTLFYDQTQNTQYAAIRGDGGVTFGNATGGSKGLGTLNVASGVYLNGTSYTNPDYALELWATGKIVKFASNHGADGYQRLSLDQIEAYVRKHLRLPHIDRRPNNGEVFERTDINLEMFEEIWTHLFEFNKRIKKLEA